MFHYIVAARYQVFRRRMLVARRRQLFVAFTLSCLLCLCACTSTPTSSKVVSHHPTPTPLAPAKGTVLFQSDWTQQRSLWQIPKGWQQTNDYLQSDVNSQLVLTIPYTPTMPNYVVEFRLQVVNVPKNGGYFQFAAARQKGEDGYKAYVSPLLDGLDQLMWVHPAVGVMIDPLDNMDKPLDTHDYEPTNKWRTYQVVVTGSFVDFYVDGFRLSYALSLQTHTLSRGPFQFTCTGAVLRLGTIRVLAG